MLSLLLTAALLACGSGQYLSATEFPYSKVLLKEPKYDLSWNYNRTHIIFRTQVATEGYTGFGISKDGLMTNSDVVIGWVSKGEDDRRGKDKYDATYFSDRFAFEHAEPKIDQSQDWLLISGEEEDDTTTLVFIRRLNTCDKYDYPIKKGEMTVIFSLSREDPDEDGELFHHYKRGKRVVVFINSTAVIDETPCPY